MHRELGDLDWVVLIERYLKGFGAKGLVYGGAGFTHLAEENPVEDFVRGAARAIILLDSGNVGFEFPLGFKLGSGFGLEIPRSEKVGVKFSFDFVLEGRGWRGHD